jgi:hypothetical protein
MNSTCKTTLSAALLAFAFLIASSPSSSALVTKPNGNSISALLNSSSLIIEVRGRGKRPHRAKRRGRRPNAGRPNRPGANRPNRPNRPGANRPNRNKWKKRARRRFWGRVVGGVVLGTTIAVATAGRVPARPSADLCWTWTNNARTRGYWYYCVEPY